MASDPDTAGQASTPMRIDLLRDLDVAYWCRLLDVDHGELRRAVQCVGPRADAVMRHLERLHAQRTTDGEGSAAGLPRSYERV